MTSPTATARPWATPRSRPAARAREETRSRTKTVGPGLRDTPAEGGSVSQISASARQSARRQGIRPSSQGVDPIEAGSRGGSAAASGGGDQPAEPGLDPTAVGRRAAVRADAAGVAARPQGKGVLQDRLHGGGSRLSPAAGPTRCATRRSGRRRSVADRAGAPACRREAGTARLPRWTNGRNRTRRLVRELGRGRRRR